jgi:hypothetical protein
MVSVLLKLVTPVMLEETLKVTVTATDWPAARLVPCWFQLTDMYVLAPVGLQLLAAKLRLIEPVPVFFT